MAKQSVSESTPAKAPEPVIRALDLGWGYTKYSRKNEAGALVYESFPSLAPRSTGVSFAMGAFGRRNTVVVDVDGTLYEVGPDSSDLDSGDVSRSLNDHYIHTDQYRALFLGALHYIGEPVIDCLVVGLPLSGMGSAEKLREMMVGTHPVASDQLVTVQNAIVLPQPMGGLYYCRSLASTRPEFEFLDEEQTLVVDPGFLTFDFLMANGTRAVETRSGAQTGGVSKVLRAIADSLSAKFGVKYENLMAIDKGLRRRKLKIAGVTEELEPHIRNTRAVLESSVNYMRNIVGDGSDIDNIILIGGGAGIFLRTLETYYPKHQILQLEDGQLANVRGFQLAGEELMARKR